jgi:hypothetical protein
MAIGAYVFSQKVYPNEFEWGKIFLSLFSAVFIFFFSRFIGSYMTLWISSGICFVIYTILVLYFFRKEAREVLRRMKGKKAL